MRPAGPRRRRAIASSDGWPRSMPTRSSAAIRRSCAASAGTTSTRFVRLALQAPSSRLQLQPGPPVRRLRGDARRRRSRRSCGWSSCRKAKALLVVQFADLLDALAATPAILTHSPAAVEVMDRYVLDSTKLNPEASRLRDFLHGDPGAILIVEFYGDDAERAAAAARRAGSRPASADGVGHHSSRHRRRPPRHASGSCARWRWACRWPRRATPRRSRSSRTRPSPRSTCATTSPSSCRSSPATAPRPASTPTPRSAACTSGRSSI